MNGEQRQRLEQKKAALKAKLSLQRDRQFLQDIIDRLAPTNAAYEIIPSNEASSDWIIQHFPVVSWGRLDWPHIEGSLCLEEFGPEPSADWLTRVLQAQHIDNNVWVTVLWSNGAAPSLRLRLQDAIAHLEDLSAKSFDMWLYDESDNWIVEHYHEGEWCWGRSKNQDRPFP